MKKTTKKILAGIVLLAVIFASITWGGSRPIDAAEKIADDAAVAEENTAIDAADNETEDDGSLIVTITDVPTDEDASNATVVVEDNDGNEETTTVPVITEETTAGEETTVAKETTTAEETTVAKETTTAEETTAAKETTSEIPGKASSNKSKKTPKKADVNLDEETFIPFTKKFNTYDSDIVKRAYNLRSVTITFELYRNGKPMDPAITKTLTFNSGTNSQSVIFGGPYDADKNKLKKYDENGNKYVYTVVETAGAGYKVDGEPGIDSNTKRYTITNDISELVDINVKKIWDDENNKNNTRPSSIFLYLYRDGSRIKDVKLEANGSGNEWEYTFEDLPKYYRDGSLINWTVKERTVQNYVTKEESIPERKYEITNELSLPKGEISIPVKKIWYGDDEDSRPDEITITLEKPDGTTESLTLNKDNDWEGMFTGLPYNDGKGNVYTYQLSEDKSKLEGYLATSTTSSPAGLKPSISIPSTSTPINYSFMNEKIEIDKKVNNAASYDLDALNEIFTYKITSKVPETIDKVVEENPDAEYYFQITDELADVLEFAGNNGDVEMSIAGDIEVSGNKLTYTLGKDAAVANAGKEVTITFKAKIKSGVTIDQIAAKFGSSREVPNKAKVEIPNFSNESEIVKVTPPEPTFTSIPVEKTWVNAGEEKPAVEVKLLQNGNPYDGDPASITLNEENEWKGEFKDLPEKDADGNTYEYTVEEVEVDGYISAVEKASEGGYTIINDGLDIDKKVNNVEHYDLENVEEVFEYEIKTAVPKGAKDSFVITDELESVLEFTDDDPVVNIDAGTFEKNGQILTYTLTADEIAAHLGESIEIKFNAVIKEGADLTPYIYVNDGEEETVKKEGKIYIPNKAQIKVDNVSKESDVVTVTPPPDVPDVEKVADKTEIKNLDEEITYTITTDVPVGAETFYISDTLNEVLEYIDGSATIKIEGVDEVPDEKLTADATGIEYDLSEYCKTNPGAEVVITLRAKIKADANLDEYYESGIPNEAKIVVDDMPASSETVTIIPPPDKPEVDKKVNEKEHEDLESLAEVFTYDITSTIPKGTTKLVLTDELEPVLKFSGAAEDIVVSIGDEEISDAEIKIEGQLLTVTLGESITKANIGKKVKVTFDAKVKDGVDLKPYKTNGKILIPNTATVVLNDNPDTAMETKPVTVSPPPDDDNPNETTTKPDETQPDTETTKTTPTTRKTTSITKKSPKTGDSTNAIVWAIILIAAALTAVTVLRRRMSNR